MTSPARNHFLRATAAQVTAAAEAANPMRHATGHELMLAQLAEHKRQLRQIQSIERKADAKRAMLPDYAAWVQGVLDSDSGLQDEVFMSVMVWHIDVGDFAGALPLAAYAIRHGLVMPDQYQRTTATLIAEEYAGMAIKAAEAGQPVDTGTLSEVATLVEDQDMPDEVRAKLHKAIGYGYIATVDTQQTAEQQQWSRKFALEHLQRALELHDKVGVKKDIERLERDIKNAAPSVAREGDGKG
ncbi:terminase endonuclease subunit [Cupriavidus metallidurans]|uniref:phage terminase small subunit n=1 Tax=Cupriavidus metallidurans TaxID=119219 RepID=UPI001CCD7FD1|nr:terminase endonuclease subunit [Cupriavidus metallidurans]UBM11739.1 terminase endonuclease subunit [Cupriavidus metallidurans]